LYGVSSGLGVSDPNNFIFDDAEARRWDIEGEKYGFEKKVAGSNDSVEEGKG
jgi:hypothetical protein